MRVALSVLSAAAALIHFAVMSEHFSEHALFGAFFAVVAWAQMAWAAAVLVRGWRALLVLGALGNALVIGVWAVSRVWGVPVGPSAGVPEAVTWPDLVSTLWEVGIVAVCLGLLTGSWGRARPPRRRHGAVALALVGVVATSATTLSLTPIAAGAHDHGTDAHAASPVAGHAHSAVTGAHVTDAHATGGPVHDPTRLVLTDGLPEVPRDPSVLSGGHQHLGPSPHTRITNAFQRAVLADQLVRARAAAMRYPTAASAAAAGLTLSNPYIPLIGSHWATPGAAANTTFDVDQPNLFMYAGDAPDSPIVGIGYYVTAVTRPSGFASPDAAWHRHYGLCQSRTGAQLAPLGTDPQRCARLGGTIIVVTGWLLHAWVVPGWENVWGTFSPDHPDLRAPRAG